MSDFHDEVWRRYREPRTFIARLRQRMTACGVTQAQLARRSGFEESNICRWMRGRRPTMETMVLLDEAIEELERERKSA